MSKDTASAGHRVKLIKNPNFSRNGVMAYAKALRKFNIKPTLAGPFDMIDQVAQPFVQPDAQRGKSTRVAPRKLVTKDADGKIGEISAKDINGDSEYTAQVEMWSCELPKGIRAAGTKTDHNIFDWSKSSTFKWSAGQNWTITYGDSSSAGGSVGKDVVEVGGLVVKNQAIELAETISTSFQNNPADGLCGLAWGSINTVMPCRVKTPVENMVAQSAIPTYAELFTAYLGSYKDASDPDRGQSFYTFGFIDKDVVKSTGSDVYYTPIDNSNGFWQFSSASCTINGTVTKFSAGRTAIADTGTSLALVEDAACKAIYDAIPGSKLSKEAGGYIFPKATATDKLPVLGVDIGGKMFRLNKEDLAYAPVSSDMVYGGVQSAGDLAFNIYGDTFLKAVYAVFDCGRQRFGCVQRVEPDKPKPADKKDDKPSAQKDATPAPKPAPSAPAPSTPAPPPPATPKPDPPKSAPVVAPVIAAVVPFTPAPTPAAPSAAPPVAKPSAPSAAPPPTAPIAPSTPTPGPAPPPALTPTPAPPPPPPAAPSAPAADSPAPVASPPPADPGPAAPDAS